MYSVGSESLRQFHRILIYNRDRLVPINYTYSLHNSHMLHSLFIGMTLSSQYLVMYSNYFFFITIPCKRRLFQFTVTSFPFHCPGRLTFKMSSVTVSGPICLTMGKHKTSTTSSGANTYHVHYVSAIQTPSG